MKNALFILLAVALISPLMIFIYFFKEHSFSTDPSDWESFGGYFGGMYGSLLGFLSTGLVVWTFQNQMKESRIRNQQDTFFKLFDLFSHTISEIRNKAYSGEDGLRSIYIDWVKQIRPYRNRRKNNTLTIQDLKNEYESFYLNYRNKIGHYFRILYHIVKYIDNSSLDEDDKRQYIGFLRSKLSQIQLRLLFYNCLIGPGKDKFKPLIEKYSFFNNLDIDDAQPTITYFKHLYKIEAFVSTSDKEEKLI